MKAGKFFEQSSKAKFLIIFTFFFILAVFVFRDFLFTPGTIGHHWDWNIPTLPSLIKHIADTSFYGWNELNFGYARYSYPSIFYFIFYSFGYLGLSGAFVSKFWIIFVVVLSGITMFYLVEDILKREFLAKRESIIFFSSLFAGYFYALSPFMFNELVGGGASQFFTYALLPLPIYFFRKILDSKFKLGYGFLLAIVLFLISFSVQSFLLISVVLWAYALIYPKRLKSVKILLLVYSIFLLFNVQWIIQSFQHMFGGGTTFITPESIDLARLKGTNIPTISQIFVGTGYFNPLFTTSIDPAIKPFWLFSSFSMITIVFVSLFLISKKRNKESVFWSILLFLSFVTATGGHQPFGDFVIWLYENVPLMLFFRSSQHLIKLSTFILSILLGLGIFSFALALKKKSAVLLIPFILITIWISPFFSGNLGADYLEDFGFAPLDTYRLSPGYEKILNDVNNEKGDFRILYLPMSLSPYYLETEYQRLGQGGDPAIINSLHPTITADFVKNPNVKKYAAQLEKLLYEKNSPQDISRLLGVTNIKYIILRKDVQPHFGPYGHIMDWSKVYENLKQVESIELVEEHKYASLWKNKDLLPRIYGTDKIVYLPRETNDFSSLVMNSHFPLKTAYFQDADAFQRNKEKSDIVYYFKETDFLFTDFKSTSREKEAYNFEKETDLENWFVSPNFESDLSLDSAYAKEGNYSLRAFYNYSLKKGGGNVNLEFSKKQDPNSIKEISLWYYFPKTSPVETKVKLYLYDRSWNVLYGAEYPIEKGWNYIDFLTNVIRVPTEIKILRLQFDDSDFALRSMPIYIDDLVLKETPMVKGIEYSENMALPLSANSTVSLNVSPVQNVSKYELGIRANAPDGQGILLIKNKNKTKCEIPLKRNLDWVWCKTLELDEGNNQISITSNTDAVLDTILVKSFGKDTNHTQVNVSSQKINPTKYEVHVNTTDPFFLVFSESYDSRWKVYTGDVNWLEALWKEPIPNNQHFLVNGYANAWHVNKTGEYKMTLYFWPQSLYYIGFLISGIIFVISLGYYFIWIIKKRSKEKGESHESAEIPLCISRRP